MSHVKYVKSIFYLFFILLCGNQYQAVSAVEYVCQLVDKSENTHQLIKQKKVDNTIYDLNNIDCNGKNLMEVALADSPYLYYVSDIRPGRYDNVLWLLNNGFDVDQAGASGNTPLHQVAKKGDINLIYLFVDRGADINARNNLGETPLSLAIQSNSEAFNLLLHLGADYKIVNNSRRTVLQTAIDQRKPQLVEILLQHGVNPSYEQLESVKEHTKKGLLNRREAIKIVSLIKEYQERRTKAILRGSNLQKLTFNPPKLPHKQLLPSQQDPSLVRATRNNDIDTVRKLVSNGVELDAISQSGSINDDQLNATALHIALSSGYTEIASFLIKSGANISIKNAAGHYPIFLAANNIELTKLLFKYNIPNGNKSAIYEQTALLSDRINLEVANFLIAEGANVNYQTRYGYTPLHHAVFNNNLPLIKLLLDKSARVDLGNSPTETPLYYATRNNQPKIVALLLKNGANEGLNESYELAVFEAYNEIEVILKQAGADYRDRINYFRWAVVRQKKAVVKKLLNEGLDSYLKTEKGSRTLDIIDSPNIDYELVKLLVERGANVNIADENGQTPLHIACELGYFNIVELLLEHGANVEAQDDYSRTPLYAAVRGPIDLQGRMAADWAPPDYSKKLPEYIKIIKLFTDGRFNPKLDIQTSFGNIEESIQDLKNSENKNLKTFSEKVDLIIKSYKSGTSIPD